MNTGSGWSNFSATVDPTQFNKTDLYQTYPKNNNTLSAVASKFNNEETRRRFLSPNTQKRSVIDETFEMLRQIVEIKKFLGQNQLSSGLSTSIGDISNQFITRQLPSELIAMSLIHKNIVDNNRNVGFRGRLCYDCCSYWIDLVYNNKQEGMKSLLLEKPPRHECDPKKVLEISKYNFQDLANKKNQLYNNLSDLFTLMVSSLILYNRKQLSLHIEEIVEQDDRQLSSWLNGEDCINLGNVEEIKESHWAYRAIKQDRLEYKKSITIGNSELADFFRTARATFGAFRVQTEEDYLAHYFFVYFDILN